MSGSEYRGRFDEARVTNEPLSQQYLNRWPELEDEAFNELADRLSCSSLPALTGLKPVAGSLTEPSSSVVGEPARGRNT